MMKIVYLDHAAMWRIIELKSHICNGAVMKLGIPTKAGPAPQGESLGQYVKKVREFRGLSKAAVAKAARIAYTTIARIESGKTQGTKLHHGVARRLAMTLQIPEEYLRAAIRGRCFVDEFPSNKICPKCWEPAGTIDERWAMADVKYCFFCGQKMIFACPRCKLDIHLDAKFCPECGLSYKDLLVQELVERRRKESASPGRKS
jgi:transcriptional regulator with XRE-family HTH domain